MPNWRTQSTASIVILLGRCIYRSTCHRARLLVIEKVIMKRDRASALNGGEPVGAFKSGGTFSQAEFDFAVWIAKRQPLAREMGVLSLSILALPLLREAKRIRKIGHGADLRTILAAAENDPLYHRALSLLTELQIEFIISIVSTAIATWNISETN
jgi:hypothetical protein